MRYLNIRLYTFLSSSLEFAESLVDILQTSQAFAICPSLEEEVLYISSIVYPVAQTPLWSMPCCRRSVAVVLCRVVRRCNELIINPRRVYNGD